MIKDLGTGSSGSVTLVRHISMDQERALKKVPKASAFAESALSEARLLKSLEHPSIPRIFDFEEDNCFSTHSRHSALSAPPLLKTLGTCWAYKESPNIHNTYSKMIFFIRLQLSHSFFIISHSSLLYAFKAFIAQMYSKKKKLPTISDKNI